MTEPKIPEPASPLPPGFLEWWEGFYGKPEDYNDTPNEQAEYHIRRDFAMWGWAAAAARGQHAANAFPALVRVLQKCEWSSDYDGFPTCPICEGHEGLGHVGGCELAKVLKMVESPPA